jgi:hypothetical protein
VLKLTPAGRKRLPNARRLKATLAATFKAPGQATARDDRGAPAGMITIRA